MGQFAAPAGALAGGAAGFFLGGGWGGARFGAAAGWLVGSWLGASTTKSKNEIIDPGAQELPRFNTSVRGATIPVLFGTNKVPAQLVWQNNAEVIRSETHSGGGGKGGGSGGGGGGKGGAKKGTTEVSYEYKIDIIYHLGMTDGTYALTRVWNGLNQIDSSSLVQINTNYPVGFLVPPYEEGGSPTLTFDSAEYFDGTFPATSSWSVLDAFTGRTMRWPGTAWIGFDGLHLGSSPNIPQLSFEIGPRSTGWTFNARPAGKTDPWVVAGNSHIIDRKPDAWNNIWELMTVDSGSGGILKVFNGETGALITTYNLETIVSQRWPSAATGSADYTFHDHHSCILNKARNKLYYLSTFVGGASSPADGAYICYGMVANIDSGGGLTWLGQWYSIIDGCPEVGKAAFGLCGEGEDTDKIIFSVGGNPSSPLYFSVAPSFREAESCDNTPYLTTQYTFNDPNNGINWCGDYTNDGVGNSPTARGIILPYYVGGVLQEHHIYYYFGKSFINGSAFINNPAYDNPWLMGLRAAFPNGMLCVCNIPADPYLEANTSGSYVGTIDDPDIDFARFITIASGAQDYLAGDNLDSTGVTNTLVSYAPDAYVERLPNGGVVVIWTGFIPNDSTYVGTSYDLKTRIGAYIYDSTTRNFTEIGTSTIASLGQLSAFGGTNSVGRWNAVHTGFNRIGNSLYMYARNSDSHDTPRAVTIWSIIAQMDAGIGKDVTPPYIIKEILTNSVFGLYPGADIIDSTSYQEAVDYCVINGFYVSAQYRREEGGESIIANLLGVYGGWLTIDATANKVKFGVMDLSYGPVRTIDNNHLVRNGDAAPVITTKGAGQDTYNLVRVNFIDRNLGYQQNQIEEGDEVDQDLNGVKLREFPPVFVMNEQVARMMATRALWTNLYTKDTHKFKLGWKDADLEPGDMITLVDSFSNLNQVVQITHFEENEKGIFDVVAQQQLQYIAGYIPSNVSSTTWDYMASAGISSYTSAASPYEWTNAGGIYGVRDFAAFELPKEFELTDAGKVYFAWCAYGKAAGATLYLSADNTTFAAVKQATPWQIAGSVLSGLPTGTTYQENVDFVLHPSSAYWANSVDYDVNVTLPDVSQEAMHNGAGLMWVGSEMVAYAGLTLLAQNKYRAAKVYRGWGGTQIGAHSSGDIFYKHGAGVFAVDYTANQIGNTLYYKVAPFGFDGIEFPVSSITAKAYNVAGLFYKPRVPSTPQYGSRRGETKFNVGSAGDISVCWHDGAQQSGFGAGGYGKNPGGYGAYVADVASLGYHVAVVGSGSAVVRSSYVNTPAYTYTNSQNFSDNGAWRGSVAFRVTPNNPYGLGPGTSVLSLELFF